MIRSDRVDVWIYYCPAVGDGVVLATVCYSSLSSRFSLLVTALRAGPDLSSQGLFKAVILGMHGVHPSDYGSLTIGFSFNIVRQ